MTLEIRALSLEGSPRLAGENEQHTRVLVEAAEKLPPVLVHRPTMRVVDGVHRLQAARLRGESTIEAVFFDGDADAAFVQAVKANIAHGLPLSLDDRRAAAERILKANEGWSDRSVAAVTGLAAATVRAIRERVTARSTRLHTRVGRDGKARPLDAASGRRRAAKVLAERPGASLREVASASGISTRTVRDVRKRVETGDDPVPVGRRSGGAGVAGAVRPGEGPASSRSNGSHHHQARVIHRNKDTPALLDGLRKDPSLRYSEAGRQLLRWLDTHFVEPAEGPLLAEAVPAHCAYIVTELASRYAEAWQTIAASFSSRTEEPATGSVTSA